MAAFFGQSIEFAPKQALRFFQPAQMANLSIFLVLIENSSNKKSKCGIARYLRMSAKICLKGLVRRRSTSRYSAPHAGRIPRMRGDFRGIIFSLLPVFAASTLGIFPHGSQSRTTFASMGRPHCIKMKTGAGSALHEIRRAVAGTDSKH